MVEQILQANLIYCTRDIIEITKILFYVIHTNLGLLLEVDLVEFLVAAIVSKPQ